MNPYPGPTHPASNPPPNPAEQAGGTGETEQRTALLGGGQTGARPGRRRGLIGLGVLGVLAVGGVAGALVLGGGSGSAPGSGGPAPVGGPFVGDFDGDGRPDLGLNAGTGQTAVLFNAGNW